MKKIIIGISPLLVLIAIYSTQIVHSQTEEKQPRQIFEVSGQQVICRLEKKVITGTISQKELKLLYDIFIFYLKEIVKEDLTLEEEELVYKAFRETALFYRKCSEEERKKELESYREKCGPPA